MDYENQELIDTVDKLANNYLAEKNHHKHRDHFFPYLINELNLKVGVEVGVDKAAFSEKVLARSNVEKYYCVDTWQDDFGSDHRPGYFDKDGSKRYQEAYNTLKKYVDSGRAEMLQMTGVEASTKFEPSSIDFCYIDGDHSLEGIYTDIKAWLPKLAIGGIIAGHDYKDGPKSGISDYFGNQLCYRIKTVTHEYCMRYGHKLNSVGGRILSWWFVKNRRTEDHVKAYLLQAP